MGYSLRVFVLINRTPYGITVGNGCICNILFKHLILIFLLLILN